MRLCPSTFDSLAEKTPSQFVGRPLVWAWAQSTSRPTLKQFQSLKLLRSTYFVQLGNIHFRVWRLQQFSERVGQVQGQLRHWHNISAMNALNRMNTRRKRGCVYLFHVFLSRSRKNSFILADFSSCENKWSFPWSGQSCRRVDTEPDFFKP